MIVAVFARNVLKYCDIDLFHVTFLMCRRVYIQRCMHEWINVYIEIILSVHLASTIKSLFTIS